MKNFSVLKRSVATISGLLVVAVSVPVSAVTKVNSTPQPTDQAHVSSIITKGDQEISRRLISLSKLNAVVNAAQKLSVTDKATLSGEVNNEITGLNSLKTHLDTQVTLAGARTDAQSIVTGYRVYALITPKVYLVKSADDQIIVEGKLNDLAVKLQARITAAKTSGKDVTNLQLQLSDMTAKTQAAQAISTSTELKVVNLQPSDYNSDHTILSGDRDQLKVAHSDNQTANTDAKAIVSALLKL